MSALFYFLIITFVIGIPLLIAGPFVLKEHKKTYTVYGNPTNISCKNYTCVTRSTRIITPHPPPHIIPPPHPHHSETICFYPCIYTVEYVYNSIAYSFNSSCECHENPNNSTRIKVTVNSKGNPTNVDHKIDGGIAMIVMGSVFLAISFLILFCICYNSYNKKYNVDNQIYV